MTPEEINALNEMLRIEQIYEDLARDIDDYVREATWTPTETNLLYEMLLPLKGLNPILDTFYFDDSDPPIEDGHDLVERLWKEASKPLPDPRPDKDTETRYKSYVKYLNLAIDTLQFKPLNKLPTLIGNKNLLAATIASWRLKLGR
jgi:hypothetical protein